MDFTHQETLVLLNIYKKFPILWDLKARGYHDRKLKANAWNEISKEVKVHPEICKRKIDSLFASYRREKRKLDKSRKSDAPEDVMTPKWRFWNAFRFVRGLSDGDEDPLGDGPEEVRYLLLSMVCFIENQMLFWQLSKGPVNCRFCPF